MADERDDSPEGWRVPHRPAVIAAVAVPVALALLLALSGRFYTDRLRPSARQPVHEFPAPGLETYIHDGANDPYYPPTRARPDPAIDAAKRSVTHTGLAGWEAER